MNTFEDFRKAIGMTQEAMAKELEISKSKRFRSIIKTVNENKLSYDN